MRDARGRALAEAVARHCPLRLVDEGLLASLAEVDTSQGILALARRPVFDEARILSGTPLVLVAAGVQDPGNVGALLRTAEAAGATGAYLTAGSADAFSWKALRGSMGSAFRLPHQRVRAAADVITRLRRARLRLIGASMDAVWGRDPTPNSASTRRRPPGTIVIGVVTDATISLRQIAMPTIYLPLGATIAPRLVVSTDRDVREVAEAVSRALSSSSWSISASRS